MKKQFDLQYYLEHPETKIVTRDGKSARVICTDSKTKASYNIICLVLDDKDEELAFKFTKDGKFIENMESDLDLFFDLLDPVKKRVPLTYEDLLERIKVGKTMWMQQEYAPGCYSAFNIMFFNHVGIKYEDAILSYKDIIDSKFTFANGDICWKEVEE